MENNLEKENKVQEEKQENKDFNANTIVKIITGLIMLGIIFFLINENYNIFGKTKTDTSLYSAQQNLSRENSQITIAKSNTSFNHRLIGPTEYKEKLESGDYIHIDIRTLGEYNESKIEEGLNIDFYASDFKENLNKLDKTKKYIYHCRSGSRTSNAVSIFKELGFEEVLELEGGMNNWRNFYPVK